MGESDFALDIEVYGHRWIGHEPIKKAEKIAAKCPIQRTLEATPIIQATTAT